MTEKVFKQIAEGLEEALVVVKQDELVEKVARFLIERFQHCDCPIEQCSSYQFRTEGRCYCRDSTRAALRMALEEAAMVADAHEKQANEDAKHWDVDAGLRCQDIAAAIRALIPKD